MGQPSGIGHSERDSVFPGVAEHPKLSLSTRDQPRVHREGLWRDMPKSKLDALCTSLSFDSS